MAIQEKGTEEEEGNAEEWTSKPVWPKPPASPPPAPPQGKVNLMAGERELTTGMLAKESSFRLIVTGNIGVDLPPKKWTGLSCF